MSQKPTKTLDHIHDELSRLRWDVNRLESAIPQGAAQQTETVGKPQLSVFFEKVKSLRRPVVVRFEGSINVIVRLSNVRAAILLPLLLDLEDRGDGGRGLLDPIRSMEESYAILAKNENIEPGKIADRVRVALYRFAEFLNDELRPKNKKLPFRFEHISVRLIPICSEKLTVEVATSDSDISRIIDALLATSPLARVRKYKAMFMPSGNEAYDRLLLEFFDHRYPVSMTTMFVRPAVHHLPTSILNKLDSSEYRLKRRAIVLKGFESHRCRHREILRRDSVWDLIRVDEKRRFVSYPQGVSQGEVLEHLEVIAENLRNFRSYSLVLTDAPFPFLLVSLSLDSSIIPEYFTMLYQTPTPESLFDISAFVICDQNVSQGVSSRVIEWVTKHPASTTDREEALSEIQTVSAYLASRGPLRVGEARPGSRFPG